MLAWSVARGLFEDWSGIHENFCEMAVHECGGLICRHRNGIGRRSDRAVFEDGPVNKADKCGHKRDAPLGV